MRAKQGFSIPMKNWIRGELLELTHDEVFSSRLIEEHFPEERAASGCGTSTSSGDTTTATCSGRCSTSSLWERLLLTGPRPGRQAMRPGCRSQLRPRTGPGPIAAASPARDRVHDSSRSRVMLQAFCRSPSLRAAVALGCGGVAFTLGSLLFARELPSEEYGSCCCSSAFCRSPMLAAPLGLDQVVARRGLLLGPVLRRAALGAARSPACSRRSSRRLVYHLSAAS